MIDQGRDDVVDIVQEERIARVLRRRARIAPAYPPFEVIAARAHRPAPLAGVLAATAAAVVLALVLGNALAERRAATTAPESSTPAAAPGPEVLDPAFGFAVYEGGIARIRSETSGVEAGSFALETPSSSPPAVSPDGLTIAYWQPAIGTPVLHVRSVTGGSARAVLTGTGRQIAGRVAWSSDGRGLVAALQSDGPRPEIHSTLVSEIWTVDLASGAAEPIASRSDGGVWIPVAWDRQARLVAAGLTAVTGEGGQLTSYELIDLGRASGIRCDPATPCPYAIRATPFAPPYHLVTGLVASSDARYVALASPGLDTLWWPLAEPQRRSTIATDAGAARWRPGTSEIWWVGGRDPAGCTTRPCTGTQLVSFDVATGARAVRFTGSYGPFLQAFRVDGSAAITGPERSAGESGRSESTVVELERGRSESVTLSGSLGLTVRLSAPTSTGTPASTARPTPAPQQTPASSTARTVRLYYYDSARDRDDRGNVLCTAKGLVAVERQIPVTQSPIADTLRLLLRGELTVSERAGGVTTEFPLKGLELEEASLAGGVLTLTFTDPDHSTTGGACRTGVLRAQIDATARQFEGVREIVFRPLDVFQP